MSQLMMISMTVVGAGLFYARQNSWDLKTLIKSPQIFHNVSALNTYIVNTSKKYILPCALLCDKMVKKMVPYALLCDKLYYIIFFKHAT